MKSLLAFAVGMIAITAPCAFSQNTGQATPEDKRSAEAVQRLSAEEVQDFLKCDTKAIAGLWSDDLVVTNPLNRLVTKQQVLGMMESGFLVITSYDRRTEYVRVYGDMVVLAGNETVTWGGRMPNAGKREQLRFTAVWMKQHGRWQEIVRHANILPPMSSAEPTS
jgi:ketosteroid isomerase-like protein